MEYYTAVKKTKVNILMWKDGQDILSRKKVSCLMICRIYLSLQKKNMYIYISVSIYLCVCVSAFKNVWQHTSQLTMVLTSKERIGNENVVQGAFSLPPKLECLQ